MHFQRYYTPLIAFWLALYVGQAFCAPIKISPYPDQVLTLIGGEHDGNPKARKYQLPEKRLRVHGILSKRNSPGTMQLTTSPNRPEIGIQTPAITAGSASVGSTDEKPKFLKSVAQGLSSFFKAIKDWFKSDTRTESFKDLGRRFSSWFRNVKEKILQRQRYPIEEPKPLPGVISFDPIVPLPRRRKADDAAAQTAAEQVANNNAAFSSAQPGTESGLVKTPAKARLPAVPVEPVKEQEQALVHVEPAESVKPVKPDTPVPQVSGAEINGAASRGPESIASASEQNALVLVSQEVPTIKVSAPEAVAPKAPTLKLSTPDVPGLEVYSPKASIPEATSPKVPTSQAASPKEPTPGVGSPKAPNPEVDSPKVPTPEVASHKEATPKIRTPKVPTPEAVTPKAPTPDVPIPEEASDLTPQRDTIDYDSIRMPIRPLDQIKPPYKSMAEVELVTQEAIRKAREQNAAERLAANLDSEYEGSFDDDEAQDALRPGMGSLVDADYERLRKLPSGYRSPFNSEYESGPPRGRIGTFSKKADKELRELQAEGYEDYPMPHFDEGVRKNPSYLDPMDSLFLEQGLDPLKIDPKDRRNYAIILEWYKQTKAPQDRKHPNHRELYEADHNPPPDEHGRRYLWGTDTYMEQSSRPAPVPYIREKMKEAGNLEKIGEMGTFGLFSNDPNRPHFWFHDWLPGFDRKNEIEDWIELNIPATWIQNNFPTEVGPVSRRKYEGLSPLERKARLIAYNNGYKDAANRKNKKNAHILHKMGQADACAQAVRVGGSQAAAGMDFPCEEEILKNRTLWDSLKARLFTKQERHNLLKQAKNMHNIDREDLHMRLEADGVLVVDEP
ncbi:hypothetical protein EV426DRAFT_612216 [Tirmania nivea]|nr:hypothetical protein EV426DRAFT_612216 [Tirmania nivea]